MEELETADPELLGEDETVFVPSLPDVVLSLFFTVGGISMVIFLVFVRSSLKDAVTP